MFEYKYTTDNKTRYLTVVHFIVFAVVAATLCLLVDGGYILAWFISIAIAIVALMALSIPRRIILSDEGIEICCISDYTHIAYKEIESIKVVSNKQMKFIMPIFAASGFFGYYGSFLDFKSWDFVKIYALKWSNFIEITDIYEDKYYISCDQSEELIEKVLGRVSLNLNDNE